LLFGGIWFEYQLEANSNDQEFLSDPVAIFAEVLKTGHDNKPPSSYLVNYL
jgi:hypothetical protein